MRRIQPLTRHRMFSNLVRTKPPSPAALARPQSPWVEQKDPKGSSLTYWWNTKTNETTALGAPKPIEWVEVRHESGMTYWWDPESNRTTALGAPRPPSQLQAYTQPIFTPPISTPSLGSSMLHYMTLGFGLSMGMILVRVLLGG